MNPTRIVRLLNYDTINQQCLVLERMPGETLCASIRWVPWSQIRIYGRSALDAQMGCLNPQLFLTEQEKDNA